MIVRLHNLSARFPTWKDTEAVTELMRICDIANSGSTDTSKADVEKAWRAHNFDLKTDAWVIITHKGLLIGYADVRQESSLEHLVCLVRIHPKYCERGIGTLFTLLIEERARQLVWNVQPGKRVTLSVTICVRNRSASHLLEREGYMSVKRFWRLSITDGDVYETFTVDLNVEAQDLFDVANLTTRTGLYVARQYEIYEKELRPDAADCADKVASNNAMEPQSV